MVLICETYGLLGLFIALRAYGLMCYAAVADGMAIALCLVY